MKLNIFQDLMGILLTWLMKNENNEVMKTIGKHYDILQIINIEVVKDINNINRIVISIFFVMNNDADNYVIKLKNFISRNQMIKAFEIVINKFEFYFFDFIRYYFIILLIFSIKLQLIYFLIKCFQIFIIKIDYFYINNIFII